jgi:hypothetical protein
MLKYATSTSLSSPWVCSHQVAVRVVVSVVMRTQGKLAKDHGLSSGWYYALVADASTIPERLLRRLDDIGSILRGRADALALIGLGSVGLDLDRLDEHSDLDFFVVVDEGAKRRYLESIDWLEAASPVVHSFANTVDGRKALFSDGLFAEYAVFEPDELRSIPFPPGRLVWAREDAPSGLERAGRLPDSSSHDDPSYQVDEALTNLYVGLHREARGERLSATRLIQQHAVDRLLTYLELTSPAPPRQDPFALERGVEKRFGPDLPPLSKIVLGYDRNREAALAVLGWLEARADVDQTLASEIRRLAGEGGGPPR